MAEAPEPWIETRPENAWDGELAELRSQVVDRDHDRVDWIMRVHSLDPGSLDAHDRLYRQAMRGTRSLRKVERELIAFVVSSVNECHYESSITGAVCVGS